MTDGGQAPWWVRATRWRQTSWKEGVAAEKQLMAIANCNIKVEDVPLGPTRNHFVHTLTGGSDDNPKVVLVPGYAAGSGFFYRNFNDLCGYLKLYAVDWLGTGLSGRPRFTAKTQQEAEDFFTDTLTQYTDKAGLDKFILVGHSLGGYLAAAYAIKHPEKVEHLVLVCPAGVPHAPEDWENKFMGKAGPLRKGLFKTFMWAWSNGVTPGSFIRGIGPLGPWMVNGYVSKRFNHHESEAETKAFAQYMYSILADAGSGEYALRHLLAPGAWAHAPLAESLKHLKVPVTFIYGETDWMNPSHAVELVKELRALRKPKVPSDLTVQIIPNSGHFTFLDDSEAFNRAMLLALKPYLKPKPAASADARLKAAGDQEGNVASVI